MHAVLLQKICPHLPHCVRQRPHARRRQNGHFISSCCARHLSPEGNSASHSPGPAGSTGPHCGESLLCSKLQVTLQQICTPQARQGNLCRAHTQLWHTVHLTSGLFGHCRPVGSTKAHCGGGSGSAPPAAVPPDEPERDGAFAGGALYPGATDGFGTGLCGAGGALNFIGGPPGAPAGACGPPTPGGGGFGLAAGGGTAPPSPGTSTPGGGALAAQRGGRAGPVLASAPPLPLLGVGLWVTALVEDGFAC